MSAELDGLCPKAYVVPEYWQVRPDTVHPVGSEKNWAFTTCVIPGQQIPVDEPDEHMHIELLNPKWKSQRDALEARKIQPFGAAT